jgi:2-oxo-4-hydroxy-4-carboxy-5-ureidoimidazoline decarboxylase
MLDAEARLPHARLNAMSEEAAREALTRCCGASRWVQTMLEHRPFGSTQSMFALAANAWEGLGTEDHLEAFAHHPKIGVNLEELARRFPRTALISVKEQGGVASANQRTLLALRDLNRVYEQRHGFIFIVCASGKSAFEMLKLLRVRVDNPTAVELQRAADEQSKITRLRLENLALDPQDASDGASAAVRQ